MNKKDLATLEISENNPSIELIKKQYRIMARKYHPDRPDGDAEKFKQIANAYQRLLDSQTDSYQDDDNVSVQSTPHRETSITMEARANEVNRLVSLYLNQLRSTPIDLELLQINYEYLLNFEIEFKTTWNTSDPRPWGYTATQTQKILIVDPTYKKITGAINQYKQLLLSKTEVSMQLFKDELEIKLQLYIDNNPTIKKLFENSYSHAYIPSKDYSEPFRVSFSGGRVYDEDKARAISSELLRASTAIYGNKISVAESDKKYESVRLRVDPDLILQTRQLEDNAATLSNYDSVTNSLPVIINIPAGVQDVLLFCLRQKQSYENSNSSNKRDEDTIDLLNDLYTKILNSDKKNITETNLAQLRGVIFAICMKNNLENPGDLACKIFNEAKNKFAEQACYSITLTDELIAVIKSSACCVRVISERFDSQAKPFQPTNADKYNVLSLKEVLFVINQDGNSSRCEIGFCNKEGQYEQLSIEGKDGEEIINTGEYTDYGWPKQYYNNDVITRPDSIEKVNAILDSSGISQSKLQQDTNTLALVFNQLGSITEENKMRLDLNIEVKRTTELETFSRALGDLKNAIDRELDGVVALNALSRYEILKKLSKNYVKDGDRAAFQSAACQCICPEDSELTKESSNICSRILKSFFSIIERLGFKTKPELTELKNKIDVIKRSLNELKMVDSPKSQQSADIDGKKSNLVP